MFPDIYLQKMHVFRNNCMKYISQAVEILLICACVTDRCTCVAGYTELSCMYHSRPNLWLQVPVGGRETQDLMASLATEDPMASLVETAMMAERDQLVHRVHEVHREEPVNGTIHEN